MKRLVTVAAIACIPLLMTNIVFAQGSEPTPEPIKVADLLTWATTTPPDWGRGALFAGLGFVGALVTIYGLIGGAVPGTAGQAKIDADAARLERLTEQLEKLINNPPHDAAAIKAIEGTVNSLRDDLRSERWNQFVIATIVYAVLGAAISTILAKDILQALVIGAGWTGFLGTLGLKKDYSERKEIKDTALEKTLERAKKAEEIVRGTGDGGLIRALPDEPLERDVRIAQAV